MNNNLNEIRKYLYKLEDLGVFRLISKRSEKTGFYSFEHKLTEKGEKLVKSNKKFLEYLKEKDFKRLCQEIKKLLR